MTATGHSKLCSEVAAVSKEVEDVDADADMKALWKACFQGNKANQLASSFGSSTSDMTI